MKRSTIIGMLLAASMACTSAFAADEPVKEPAKEPVKETAKEPVKETIKPKVTELKRPETILMVGNSLLYYNCGVNNYLAGFAKSKDVKLNTTMVTISGAGLDWHQVKSYLRDKGLRSYTQDAEDPGKFIFHEYHAGRIFDAVLLQGHTQEPFHPGLAKSFKESLAAHSKDIRDKGSEPVIMMTWAYSDRPDMTKRLEEATIQAANENNAFVIPVGLAFAKSQDLRHDIRLVGKDKKNPTAEGTYLESAVIFAALTKTSPVGSDFLGTCDKPLTEGDAKFLQKVAWDTVCEFYGWKK